jgi:two-component system chemotaxis response regulator CheY
MRIRVLVVDDSPFIHKVITRALPEDAYEICGVGKNGREGIELYRQLAPDVVTMDVTMPILNGVQAATEILREDPRARIILLSAMGDEELVQQVTEMGVRTTLQKPFKAPDLLAAIATALGGEMPEGRPGEAPEGRPGEAPEGRPGEEGPGAGVAVSRPGGPKHPVTGPAGEVQPGAEQPAEEQGGSYISHFRSALENTLRELAGLECSCEAPQVQEGILVSGGVAVILGVTGKKAGRVILDTSREAARGLSEAMNGEKYDLEDSFVLYSLSEVLNILSGKAITAINNRFRELNLRLGPPSIFVGSPLHINSPKIRAEVIRVTTAAGDIYLNVGFEGGER